MAYTFILNKESLKRKFAVYVVVAKSNKDINLYVGKTGDNRDGCNPLISRCGNHFSYNKMHSQIRNHLEKHEGYDYTYIFDHFDDYAKNKKVRRSSIDKINEMERWLNEEIQNEIKGNKSVRLINPFTGHGYLSEVEQTKRRAFRTSANAGKIKRIVAAVGAMLG